MSDVRANWEAFLNPEILRSRLISASLYLAAYEILKDSIVERIKDFYSSGFDEKGLIVDADYKTKVLSRNASPLYASLSWLKENGVIDGDDLKSFEAVRECRNAVAHELPKLVAGTTQVDHVEKFSLMAALIRKIDVWWVVNVEIATDPDLAGQDIDEQGIVPGSMITLQLMLDIALGDSEKANYYLEEFKKRVRQA